MGVFDKTRYVRVLLFLAPLGLLFIYFGINILIGDVDDFSKHIGRVSKINKHENYFEYCKCNLQSIEIRLENQDEVYKTSITEYIEVIDRTLKVGDKIVIWTYLGSRINEVAQLERNGVVIIPYEKAVWVGWGFLLAGLITSFIAIGYLIKYPEDILGKKSSR